MKSSAAWRLTALPLLLAAAAAAAIVPGRSGHALPPKADTLVQIGDSFFCGPAFQGDVCQTTISPGDKITWSYPVGDFTHTTTECGASCDSPTASPVWDSGPMRFGATFAFTFDSPGTFRYYCQFHPGNMRGVIVVRSGGPEPAPTQPPSLSPTAQPGPSPTQALPSPTPVSHDPSTPPTTAAGEQTVPSTVPSGGGPPPAGGSATPLALTVAGAIILAAGALFAARWRRGPSEEDSTPN